MNIDRETIVTFCRCSWCKCPKCPVSLQKRVYVIAVLDLILAILPIALYSTWALVLGGLWIAGCTEKPNKLLKFVLTDILSVERGLSTPYKPHEIVNQRMFLYSVWGISLTFNMVDICISLLLLQAHRARNEQTCYIWIAIRATLVGVSIILTIAILSTGESFLPQIPAIVYIIYRIVGLYTVYRFIVYLLSIKQVPDLETDI